MKSTSSSVITLEALRDSKPTYDVFICSASYEERCRSVAEAIADSAGVGQRLVCFNQKSSAQVAVNSKLLMQRLGPRTESVILDKSDPLLTADNLQRAFSWLGADDRALSYLVDITTFTHEALLILLRVLQPQASRSVIDLAYAPAVEYSVGLADDQKWLSRGITDIRSVLGYPGDSRPSRKSHLIVLVGFESDRAEQLIDEYQPHIISLGFAEVGTSTALGHEGVNRLAFQRLASKVPRYNEFEFSCTDVGAVQAAVYDQTALFPECNVVVAPMNTKLSTAGVAGAAFRDDRIQLCYASASQYNIEGYSRPGTDCIITTLSAQYWRRQS